MVDNAARRERVDDAVDELEAAAAALEDARAAVASVGEDELEAAAAALEDARAAVASVGEDELAAAADAYRTVLDVIDRYEERATDWDDFEGYVEFREELGETIAGLPEDLRHRECFEDADATLTTDVQQVLSEDDFDRARTQLEPAREDAELEQRLADARDQYREARRAATRRLQELEANIEDLQRLERLGEADLDAPTEQLRDPIEAYDESVRDAFGAFRSATPAREVLEWIAETAAYPLVDYRRPPDRLSTYLASSSAGEESIPTLLDYADHSRSKLDHYVDDPQAFKAAIGTNRTYLRGIDAEPLTVGWPPPPADRLHWLAPELVALVGRFADEPTVALARDLRALADRTDYARLRDAAIARDELDDDERERVRSNEVAREREAATTTVHRLEDALEAHPPLEDIE